MDKPNRTRQNEGKLDNLWQELREDYQPETVPVQAEPKIGQEMKPKRPIRRWIYLLLILIAGSTIVTVTAVLTTRSAPPFTNAAAVELTATPIPTPLPPTEIPIPDDEIMLPSPLPNDPIAPVPTDFPTPVPEILSPPTIEGP